MSLFLDWLTIAGLPLMQSCLLAINPFLELVFQYLHSTVLESWKKNWFKKVRCNGNNSNGSAAGPFQCAACKKDNALACSVK